LLFCTKLYTTDVHLCFRLFFTVGLVINHYAVDPYRFGQTHIVYIIRSTAVNPTFFAKSRNPGITKSPIPNPEIGKDWHGIAILPRSTGVRRSCICTCHNCDIATTWRSFWTCVSWLDEIHGQLSQWNTCRLAASHLYTSRHTDTLITILHTIPEMKKKAEWLWMPPSPFYGHYTAQPVLAGPSS